MSKTNAKATNPKQRKTNPKKTWDSAMSFEKEDIKLIHQALLAYKPTQEKEQRYSILVEGFEEVLVCDFDEDLEIPY
jgi:hypothetical protein